MTSALLGITTQSVEFERQQTGFTVPLLPSPSLLPPLHPILSQKRNDSSMVAHSGWAGPCTPESLLLRLH